jgi:glycosyltransferase involved in cell wall biosynthesis
VRSSLFGLYFKQVSAPLPDPFLSIIIPAYNEEKRLPATLTQVVQFLGMQTYLAEVLVIENGSQDRTLQIAQKFARDHPQVQVIKETERGKGRAVRRGMLAARGEYRFMADADLSMPITETSRFLPPHLVDFDVAIASRESVGSIRYNEPLYRHLGGRAINLVIRTLALPGLNDTQCGFKCFHRSAADDLFRNLTLTGWSFDIEVLYIARQRKYRIVEVPIPWYFYPESKLDVVQDALRMILDIMAIRGNARRGLY